MSFKRRSYGNEKASQLLGENIIKHIADTEIVFGVYK